MSKYVANGKISWVPQSGAEELVDVFLRLGAWSFGMRGSTCLIGLVEAEGKTDDPRALVKMVHFIVMEGFGLPSTERDISSMYDFVVSASIEAVSSGRVDVLTDENRYTDRSIFFELRLGLDPDHYNELVDSGVNTEIIATMLLSR